MTDYFEPTPDPLDHLLTPAPAPVDDAFRQAVLARSLAVLRRCRRLQRLTRVAALAACFVAGLLTLHDFHPDARLAPPPRAAITPAEAADSAVALEWQALDHPDRAVPLYRAAGDRYLAEDGDVQGAVRCYGGALTRGGADELAIEPSDSWLLIAIKDARQKEMHDAN